MTILTHSTSYQIYISFLLLESGTLLLKFAVAVNCYQRLANIWEDQTCWVRKSTWEKVAKHEK